MDPTPVYWVDNCYEGYFSFDKGKVSYMSCAPHELMTLWYVLLPVMFTPAAGSYCSLSFTNAHLATFSNRSSLHHSKFLLQTAKTGYVNFITVSALYCSASHKEATLTDWHLRASLRVIERWSTCSTKPYG